MNIPWQQLAPETLDNIIESFVLRDGTDYGLRELSLAEKVENVKRLLEQNTIVLVWSDFHQTLNFIPNKFPISSLEEIF